MLALEYHTEPFLVAYFQISCTYNDVWNIELPSEVNIIGFAENEAIVLESRYSDEMELVAIEIVSAIGFCLNSVGLELGSRLMWYVRYMCQKYFS